MLSPHFCPTRNWGATRGLRPLGLALGRNFGLGRIAVELHRTKKPWIKVWVGGRFSGKRDGAPTHPPLDPAQSASTLKFEVTARSRLVSFIVNSPFGFTTQETQRSPFLLQETGARCGAFPALNACA